jgi:protein translocase SecG subunit
VSALIWILSIVLVGLCGVIVFLILGQDVKGGGLAGALGGGSVQSAFGSRTTETVLKLTAYLVAAIFIIVVILIKLYAREYGGYESVTLPEPGPETPASTPAGK